MTDTSNRYLTGNFAPVHDEVTALDLPVTGTIPAELDGRLLRIGPNPVGRPTRRRYHWFTGHGMVHGVRLRDGQRRVVPQPLRALRRRVASARRAGPRRPAHATAWATTPPTPTSSATPAGPWRSSRPAACRWS